MLINLNKGWKILQDVHDTGLQLGLWRPDFKPTIGNQISEWEDIPELKHLQILLASERYYGRALRYFNQAPWWYRLDFDLKTTAPFADLCFSNVDQTARVWLNGHELGTHEGYANPFSFRVEEVLQKGTNTLIVRVESPWDEEIYGNFVEERTFLVYRNSVKGTYEHSDTFIPRDVNPIGIYGTVTLRLASDTCFEVPPELAYTLSDNSADITLKGTIAGPTDGCSVVLSCQRRDTGEIVCVREESVTDCVFAMQARIDKPKLWNTWDHGEPTLYDWQVTLKRDGEILDRHRDTVGFRQVEIKRDPKRCEFWLNGKPFYLRGTSYYPDLYLSTLHPARYRRDLAAIKAAGFNTVRVHVHVEQPIFYELCSELGLAVLQDSEYNWMHPGTEDFLTRFTEVFLDTVHHLKRHTSLICWIALNEPGFSDPSGLSTERLMYENPGPQIMQALGEIDPNRPVIKGSYCTSDPDSGDSHNYTGSIDKEGLHYTDIFNTREKLNSEFGVDAPPSRESLKRFPPAWQRLSSIAEKIPEIQHYQYALLKYYVEHYRMSKGKPNAGYIQFLFCDPCPQSFYGLYDWWGLPKKGLRALLESNQPIGVFLRYNKETTADLYAVNDLDKTFNNVMLEYFFLDGDEHIVDSGNSVFDLPENSLVPIAAPRFTATKMPDLSCRLILRQGDIILAKNRYDSLFDFPLQPTGHPERMTHELGMRLFSAD